MQSKSSCFNDLAFKGATFEKNVSRRKRGCLDEGVEFDKEDTARAARSLKAAVKHLRLS
jgi:hypothetical protein